MSMNVEQRDDRPHLRVVGDAPSGECVASAEDAPDAVVTERTPPEGEGSSTPVPPVEQPDDLVEDRSARNARGRAREAAATVRSAVENLLRSRGVAMTREVVVPPDLWRHDQPSLRAVWRHAIWGQHLGGNGAARFAYVVVFLVVCAVPLTIGYLMAWWHARLSRALFGWLLLWAVYHLPYVRDAIDVVVAVIAMRLHLVGIGG